MQIISIDYAPDSPRTMRGIDGERRNTLNILVRVDNEEYDGDLLLTEIPQFDAPNWEHLDMGAKYKWRAQEEADMTCVAINGPQRNLERSMEFAVSYTYSTIAVSDNTGDFELVTGPPDTWQAKKDDGTWFNERPFVSAQFILFTRYAFESQRIVFNENTQQWEDPEPWGPIINSAQNIGFADPPPERDDSRMRVVLERNCDRFDLEDANRLLNTVNLKTITLCHWRGLSVRADPYEAKMKNIIATPRFRGGEWHIRVRYEMEVRKVPEAFAGKPGQDLRFTWVQQYWDKGWMIRPTDPDAQPPEPSESEKQKGRARTYVPQDLANNILPYETLLDGKGQALDLKAKVVGDTENWWDVSQAFILNYLHYPAVDWHDDSQYPSIEDLWPIQDKQTGAVDVENYNSGPRNVKYMI